ncbi:MAG: hypothetical protein HRT44_11535 [Bdellovibrionales bacterium]|nr:hypothetical protein [Bdellovibrionales bacterium]
MRGTIVFAILVSAFASHAKKTEAGFVLFFQPLYELPQITSQSYLSELRELIKSDNDTQINALIMQKYQNDICAKKNMKSCVQGLYAKNRCLKNSQQAGIICFNKSIKAKTHHYFEESVFNRQQWNHFALNLSRHCQKTQSSSCQKLHKLHGKFFKIYRDFIIKKRKSKKAKKAWDL